MLIGSYQFVRPWQEWARLVKRQITNSIKKKLCSLPCTFCSHPAAVPILPLCKLSHAVCLNLRKLYFVRDLSGATWVNLFRYLNSIDHCNFFEQWTKHRWNLYQTKICAMMKEKNCHKIQFIIFFSPLINQNQFIKKLQFSLKKEVQFIIDILFIKYKIYFLRKTRVLCLFEFFYFSCL